VAFEKYDGTNLHWDWERDFGWHAFGTRRDEFNLSAGGIECFVQTHAQLAECVDVFQATLAKGIEKVFQANDNYRDFPSLKVFTEFFGPNSFAGLHKADDPKRLVLFDVWAEPFGMIGPGQFVADFGHLSSARVVYRGKFTGKFCEDLRQGKYDVTEGVVCKSGTGGLDLWMAKIKTYAYMDRLKAAFADRWEDYWE
jgi:RNA ligase